MSETRLIDRLRFKRPNFKISKVDFVLLVLKQNLTPGRKHIVTFVDYLAVDLDCDSISVANTFHFCPFA